MFITTIAIGSERLEVREQFLATRERRLPHSGAILIGLADDVISNHRPTSRLVAFDR
jgi:hypothetical protein